MPIPQAVEQQVKAAEQFVQQEQQAVQDSEQKEDTVIVEDEAVAGNEDNTQQQMDDWEHKYKVLQGKYNAEVPRLANENKQLRDNLAILQERLNLLEQFVRTQQDSQKQEQVEKVNTEAISSMKEDFPEIYEGVTSLLSSFKTEILKEIDNRLGSVAKQTEQVMSNTFLGLLTELVPDWQELNTDQRFLAWLSEYDTFAGKTRHDLLLDAYNAKDAKRVASFFIKFKNKHRQQKQPVVPSQSKQYSASTSTTKKIWSAEEVKDFYTKKALGKISSEQAKKIEAELMKAMEEGRVEAGF